MDIPPLYPARKQRPYLPLTDDERTVIKTLWAEGLSALAIAQKINRDSKTVAKALGSAYHNNRPTTSERTTIHELWRVGLSATQIAVRTGRSRSAIVHALGDMYDAERHSQRRHGGFGSPEYKAWECMKSRCYKPTDKCYHLYGGRGITVCDAWRSPTGFPQFLADVGPRPSSQHRLERIDNNGNYAPGNVRWATLEEQANNRRTNILLTFNGQTKTLMQWSRELDRNGKKVRARLRRGWTAEEALDLVIKPSTRLSDDAKARGATNPRQRDEQGHWTKR